MKWSEIKVKIEVEPDLPDYQGNSRWRARAWVDNHQGGYELESINGLYSAQEAFDELYRALYSRLRLAEKGLRALGVFKMENRRLLKKKT